MSISMRDAKMVWGRAAARCSNPGCRKDLVHEDSDKNGAIVGEIGHIVAESPNGPRGSSSLTDDQRNSYANLILLCPNHHVEIDKLVDRHPVELLHHWKVEHEEWIRRRLGSKRDAWEDEHYAELVDKVTSMLDLEHWEVFGETSTRDMVPLKYTEAQGELNALVLGAIWPGTRPALEDSIRNTIGAFSAYLENFYIRATVRNEYLVPDRSYVTSTDLERSFEIEDEEKAWSQRNFELLVAFVRQLNGFANIVRTELIPLFFRQHGLFLLHDEFGYRGDGVSSKIFLP